ncbi:MAG: hypothetical protein JO122_13180 [Acetobacteraceae bacterium]|nr:hypothetical protein [Acetobacteraceae bacterium]
MDHATATAALLATHFATSLFPLTVRLIPLIAQIGRLIVRFRREQITPKAGHEFETHLELLVRELGRVSVEWTFNHLEPHHGHEMPKQMCFQGLWYRRRFKSPNRKIATLFGTITLWRMLYQPVHGVEPSITPLEMRLGLEAGLATPALAERLAMAAVGCTQGAVLAGLKSDHGVCLSVASLRTLLGGVAAGMEPHRQDAQVARVVTLLEQAFASRGSRKPVLAVGRDGLMLPIRGQACYREGATATVAIYDRSGRRLGTVYLGRMPEPGQKALSRQLTGLLNAVLTQWTGPLPRLAYVTDGGYHQTEYFRRVLRRMNHPRDPGVRLGWEWVIDFYHASEYVYELAEALFSDRSRAQAWGRKMCRWLKEKPRGIYRVLHSAAALRRRRMMLGERRKRYRDAYNYLRKRIGFLDYSQYRANHLPIGSGVTEAACKTVFTQRLKQSGMTWNLDGGQWIVDLRVIQLSGVWSEAYQSYLQAKILPEEGTHRGTGQEKSKNVA